MKLPDITVASFKYREIELGTSLDNSYLIKSDLEAGEKVVTYGNCAINAAKIYAQEDIEKQRAQFYFLSELRRHAIIN